MDLSNHNDNRPSPNNGWDTQGGWTGEESQSRSSQQETGAGAENATNPSAFSTQGEASSAQPQGPWTQDAEPSTQSAASSAQSTASSTQGAAFSTESTEPSAQDTGAQAESTVSGTDGGYTYYQTNSGTDYGPHPSYIDPNPGSYSYTSDYGNPYGSGASYDQGSPYGSTDTGYSTGGGNPGGPNGPDGPSNNGRRSKRHRKKKPHEKKLVTVKVFVITLILCMIATSALTFGAMLLYTKYNVDSGEYTLTESTESLSYSSIVKMNEDSVVSITTESVATDSWAQNYVTEGAGSGVIIDSDGYILTCSHVVEDAQKITVTTNDSKDYEATVVGMDTSQEIAVLKIDATGLNAVEFGDSDDLVVGDQVICIGNPLGKLGGTVTQGIISSLNRSITIDNKTLNLLQTDASVNPGNSGGGLFNSKGELIGIIVAKSSEDSSGTAIEGIGFAIPSNTAKSVSDDLIENGGSSSSSSSSTSGTNNTANSDNSDSSSSSQSPTIGVIVSQMSASQAESAGYSEGAGLYIIRVTSVNAQSAGLKQGDKITEIDGTSISSYSDVRSILSEHRAGDNITITVSRSGTSRDFTVQLQ